MTCEEQVKTKAFDYLRLNQENAGVLQPSSVLEVGKQSFLEYAGSVVC